MRIKRIESRVRELLAAVLALSLAGNVLAASKVRLVYGERWCPAGRSVKKVLQSAEFKSAAKGHYVVELVDEDGHKMAEGNLGSLKLPAIFLISEGGNCFFVYENVPNNVSAEKLLRRFKKVDALRMKGEKEGFNTADQCGEFMQSLERYVGGPRRIISKGFYDDVYEKLKKLDPEDKTGWQRHFTMPYTDHTGKLRDCKNADGLEVVEEANWYREHKQFAEGESFVTKQQRELPVKHLTLDQKQSLLMARFALYREDALKREEMLSLLRRTAEASEDTFWGTAALGWLNTMKSPILSTYWGWHRGDFKGPKLDTTVKYGVGYSFPKAGKYTITFDRDIGAADAPRIESVELFSGKTSVAKLTKPQICTNQTTFAFDLPREYRGRMTTMVVRGTAGPEGSSSGKIRIERDVLRPRKSGKSAALSVKRDLTPACDYIMKQAGKEALGEICSKEGGAKFLKAFFSDKDWMEQFAGSGVCGGTPRDNIGTIAQALKALDLLAWNDTTGFMGTKVGRNCATALALNHGHEAMRPNDRWWNESKLVSVFECYREWDQDGTLDDSCRSLDVRQWRDVMTFGQNSELPVEALRWIHDYGFMSPIRYGYFFWQTCSYRTFNCFGASVHGSDYYRPWQHRWNTNELRFKVGAVCGGLSKFGAHCAASHGMRSYTAGQPGHCAFMLWHFGDENRWGIDYAVTGHTGAHFSTGGDGFTACEEQDRYYRHPKRMQAEAYRWQGDYKRAMAMAPGNWQAASEWADKLTAENAAEAKWDEYGKFVRKTFATAPSQGWQLYLRYLNAIKGRGARIEAARAGFLSFTENKAKTSEAWEMGATEGANAACLPKVKECFKGDQDALFELLPSMLDGQAKCDRFYKQVVNWGATELMDSKEHVRKYMTIVAKNAEVNKTKLDFKGMILTAANSDDVLSFQQVFKLITKMSPEILPKTTGKRRPEQDYGGTLLSHSGLLKISPDSEGWDHPANRLACISADEVSDGNGFHTHKSDNPWAQVILPGDCEISGITIVNSGGSEFNLRRQIPLSVKLSTDGVAWNEVWSTKEMQKEWRVQLPTAAKAKFIKVERPKDDARKEDPFHLNKILVYGKKLY